MACHNASVYNFYRGMKLKYMVYKLTSIVYMGYVLCCYQVSLYSSRVTPTRVTTFGQKTNETCHRSVEEHPKKIYLPAWSAWLDILSLLPLCYALVTVSLGCISLACISLAYLICSLDCVSLASLLCSLDQSWEGVYFCGRLVYRPKEIDCRKQRELGGLLSLCNS